MGEAGSSVFHGLMTVYQRDKKLYVTFINDLKCYGDIAISDMPGGLDPYADGNPSLQYFKNKSYVAYKNAGTKDVKILTYDGVIWAAVDNISLSSDSTPALFLKDDLLFVAGGTKQWNTAVDFFAFDGSQWVRRPEMYSAWACIGMPFYIEYQGVLLAIFTYTDNYTEAPIAVGKYDNGWSRVWVLPDTMSSLAPTAVIYNDSVMAFFRGGNGDENLYYISFSQWGVASSRKHCGEGANNYLSLYAPGALSVGQQLIPKSPDVVYLLYKSWGSSTDIWLGEFTSASTWKNDLPLRSLQWVHWPFGNDNPRTDDIPRVCLTPPFYQQAENWMSTIPDGTHIGAINLPGTHDSAAIGHSFWANQSKSITEQLIAGIRLLDVRIKTKRSDNNGVITYDFVCCHGDTNPVGHLNEFQSLDSLMAECQAFLQKSSTEAIVMSLKVDDWSNAESFKDEACRYLKRDIIDKYQSMFFFNPNQPQSPNLGQVRGRVYLLSRIRNLPEFGAPVSWPDDTSGIAYAAGQGESGWCSRNYSFYVQDEYKNWYREESKLRLFCDSMGQPASEVLLNFASGVSVFQITKININFFFLKWLGDRGPSDRPSRPGWCFFDDALIEYPFGYRDGNVTKPLSLTVIDLIVASNFKYHTYQETWKPW